MKNKSYVSKLSFIALLLMLNVSTKIYALDYTISFTGTGASTTVESVIVQNLTKGTNVTVPAGNVLNLTDIATSVDNPNSQIDGICVFPNPISNAATISFYAKQSGQAQILVFDLDGRKIIGQNEDLLQGNNSFKLSLPKGIFLIKVQGVGFSYSTKAISQSASTSIPKISISSKELKSSIKPQKSKSAVTSMLYSTGDQLLYKGKSGNYCTIVTDKPEASKTTNFDFIECKDADGNYYSVVKIGTQVWMAENLKTTKFRSGEDISYIINNDAWHELYQSSYSGWCYYNNDVANATKYGHLYNWYAAIDSRNISPLGWHVPSDTEWTTLTVYLSSNFGSSSSLSKSLAATTDWLSVSGDGAIGNNLLANNSSGFSALPGGYRSETEFSTPGIMGNWWSTTRFDYGGAWSRRIFTYFNNVDRTGYCICYGFSVRCMKD